MDNELNTEFIFTIITKYFEDNPYALSLSPP